MRSSSPQPNGPTSRRCSTALPSAKAVSGAKAVLSIANSAWIQNGFPIHDAYRQLLEANHRAEFQSVDFATGAEAARAAINTWVDEATRHKIPQLLPAGSLDSSTRLVLANAIYFKARWQRPFRPQATSDQPFHRPGQPDVDVPTMRMTAHFRYLETDTYQAIELPYLDVPYAMVVWLPKQAGGLADLERAVIAGGATAGLDQRLSRVLVQLALPKFKVSSNLSLNRTLAALGMRDAFTESANFSGITDEPLWISAAVHQALVEVDEEGTEAAAATGLVAATAAAVAEPEQMKIFRADHPFVFAIRDTNSGDLLFMGRVNNPEKK